MAVTWTTEQQKVIDLRDRNILVSAAAGSGKTAVLVERIITMLTEGEHPIDVDRLLIVTFTEAAAAEMKERIRAAIEKKLLECPENEHLKQQATLIHNARITTIHSFCLSVIRDHFPAIDLDPGFRIGEEGELKLLRHDVLEEMLEAKYQEGNQRFLDFAAAYGSGKTDKKIEELILKIYEFSRSYPDAGAWLCRCVQAYQAETLEEMENSEFFRLRKRNTERVVQDALSLVEQGLEICREADGPAVYQPVLEKDLKELEKLKESNGFVSCFTQLQELKWARLTVNKDLAVSEDKILQVKAIREEVKGLIKDLVSWYFYQDPKEMLLDLQKCYPAIEELTELVREFGRCFDAKKRQQNMIDFSDMEQYALKILAKKTEAGFAPTSIAKEYQQQFLEIMIDEYQDSNLIQETILTSVSTVSDGKYNIFMVGDVKQSIYRFRLSRPELFMEKFHSYAAEDGERQRIDLHKNFRSRREVLDSVNYLFRQIMTKELGGIDYDDQAALYTGAKYPEGKDQETEVLVIDSNLSEWEQESDDRIPEREMEARVIAGRIRRLMKEHQVADKKSGLLRPVRYSDIVILTRSIRGFADVFTEVLNREGIPAHAGTREGYFGAMEVSVTLDYLRVLDNPRQDIPLAAVLTSPYCKMTEEELARVKLAYKELPFYQAVGRYCSEYADTEPGKKLSACLGLMDAFRELVPYTPMHELIWRILDETGYGDFVSAMPGGTQRKANLEMLVEKARAYESTSYKGLFHFVRYIEQLQKYNVDYGEANIEDEQSDTVRIMTIHKSKGLEFPVVFAAGLGKRFNLQDARSSVALHAGLGIGLDAVDLVKRTKNPSIIKKIVQREEVLDSLGEELRVLYVAFTRAKEKLIITGTISNLEKKIPSYEAVQKSRQETLSYGRLTKAVTYWDWILPAVVRAGAEIPLRMDIVSIEEIVENEVEQETEGVLARLALEHWDAKKIYDPGVRERLEEQFSYQYPYENTRLEKLKFTVSELKKRVHMQELLDSQEQELGEALFEEPEIIPLIPNFLKGKEALTGASRGTAYHRFMELLDFSNTYEESSLREEMQRMHQEGRLVDDMAECIQLKDILEFLECRAACRMQECAQEGRLWKEQPFVLGVDARELYPLEQEGEMILVQGIIDVYFEEEDGLVVLDYKTDKVSEMEELAEKYHAQLEYYARALQQMTGKPVKEKIIYSFTLGEELILS